jgi:hypothetical protein
MPMREHLMELVSYVVNHKRYKLFKTSNSKSWMLFLCLKIKNGGALTWES